MIKTKLITELFDRDMRLMDRREQWARSWLRHFFDLMYVSQSQRLFADPYDINDVVGLSRPIDSEMSVTYSPWGQKAHLYVAAPGGKVGMVYSGGGEPLAPDMFKPVGHHVGIQVGSGTTAVAPDDDGLEQKIFHGDQGAITTLTAFESYITGDDTDNWIYGNGWYAQGFIPLRGHILQRVRIKIRKVGSPGDIIVSIRGGYPYRSSFYWGQKPYGADLVSEIVPEASIPTDFDWLEITFDPALLVYDGLPYNIVVRAPSGTGTSNCIEWRYDDSVAQYPRGLRCSSSDAGVTWSTSEDKAYMFEELGIAGAQLDYGGCEVRTPLFAHPNGQFTIARFFTNVCGETVTVNEVGLYALASSYGNADRGVWSFCIARDLVSPAVNVADGETLRVSYIPQITV